MKITKLSFVVLLTTAFSTASANCHESPYYQDFCEEKSCCPSFAEGFSVYGDYLYWRVRKADLDYAIPFDSALGTSIGGVYAVEPKWKSGFRVGVEKSFNCWNFDVNYLWYRNKQTDSVTDLTGDLAATRNNLLDPFITSGFMQLASGTLDLDYDLVNAVAGYACCECGCFNANIFGGFAYAHIKQDFSVFYSVTTDITDPGNSFNEIEQKWNMNGYGLTFGFEPTYQFNQCLDIFGVFSYSAFAADYHLTHTNTEFSGGGAVVTELVDIRDDAWRLSSLLDLSVGVRYKFNNPFNTGLTVALALGYEFQQWLNTPGHLNLIQASSVKGFDHHQGDLGFDGLFARLDIGF